MCGATSRGSKGRTVRDGTDARRKARGIWALEKAADGSEVENVPPLRVDMEGPFCRKLVDLIAEICVPNVIDHMKGKLEGLGTGISGGRCAFIVMMLNAVIIKS